MDGSAQKRFKGLLARVFSDGVLTKEERSELDEMQKSGALDAKTIETTMSEFLRTSFEHAKADGVITAREKSKLALIVRELRLPEAAVPEEVRRLLSGK